MLPEKYFYAENDVEKRELLPGVTARLMWGEKITIGIIDIEPDTELPKHSHPHEQAGRVLKGAAWFYVGDDEKLLTAGDHYVIPENGCVALDIWSPIREDYISDDVGFFQR